MEAPAFHPAPLDPRFSKLLEGYPKAVFNERLHLSIELMERYSIDLSIAVLERLRVTDHLADWRSAAKLRDSLSLRTSFGVALIWLLERLRETGCIDAEGDGAERRYRFRRQPWTPDLAGLRATGIAIDPAVTATLDLLDRAASIYPAVARGETSGEQALFGVDGIPLWLNYFDNDNPAYAVNNWLGAAAAAERLAGRPRLRILEVGAGAGSASLLLLRILNERGMLPCVERYLVTEPNAFFRRRGQRELHRQFPVVPLEFKPLDINWPWVGQGVAAQTFDLVLGVNVMHVARDLRFSLEQARASLAANGWLVIGECLRPYTHQPIYAEFMFQILEGFTDVMIDPDFRPNPGFLTPEQWRRAFALAGFARTEVAPDVERIRAVYPHFFTGAICGTIDGNRSS